MTVGLGHSSFRSLSENHRALHLHGRIGQARPSAGSSGNRNRHFGDCLVVLGGAPLGNGGHEFMAQQPHSTGIFPVVLWCTGAYKTSGLALAHRLQFGQPCSVPPPMFCHERFIAATLQRR
jgi:hypothetical protein